MIYTDASPNKRYIIKFSTSFAQASARPTAPEKKMKNDHKAPHNQSYYKLTYTTLAQMLDRLLHEQRVNS